MRAALLGLAGALLGCSGEPGAPEVPDAGPDAGCRIGCEAEGRWLHVSSLGVAFSSFPGRRVVTRTLEVRSRSGYSGGEVPWTAQSDQRWLTVTPNDMTGGGVTLTADPTGLAPDQQYLAEVTVRSPHAAVHNEQHVRVGLWIGSSDPLPVAIDTALPYVAADPVLPLLYTNTRGPDITVYDAYSGAVVRTFVAAVGRGETMTMSDDGTILFVDDAAGKRTVALDPQTGRELRRYEWVEPSSRGLAYARPNAHPILVTGAGAIFDVETGQRYASRISGDGFEAGVSFAVDAHSQHVYVQNHGSSPARLKQYVLDYNEQGADPLIVRLQATVRGGGFGLGLCVSADGARVYRTTGPVDVLTAAGLLPLPPLPANGVTRNAVCGWNGLFFAGASTVQAYRPNGSLAGNFQLPSVERTMVLSRDGTRITGAIGDAWGGTFRIHSAPSP